LTIDEQSKGIESIDKLYIDLPLERFGRAHHPVRSVINNTNVISSSWCEKIEYRICGILNDLYD
jgi:hypothetical protein